MMTFRRLLEVSDWLADRVLECDEEEVGYFSDASEAIDELIKRREEMKQQEWGKLVREFRKGN